MESIFVVSNLDYMDCELLFSFRTKEIIKHPNLLKHYFVSSKFDANHEFLSNVNEKVSGKIKFKILKVFGLINYVHQEQNQFHLCVHLTKKTKQI